MIQFLSKMLILSEIFVIVFAGLSPLMLRGFSSGM